MPPSLLGELAHAIMETKMSHRSQLFKAKSILVSILVAWLCSGLMASESWMLVLKLLGRR